MSHFITLSVTHSVTPDSLVTTNRHSLGVWSRQRAGRGAGAGTSEPVLNHNTDSDTGQGRLSHFRTGLEDYICCHPDYYWRTLILSSQLLLMTRLVRMATMLGMRLHWKLIPGLGSLVRLITAGVTVSHHDGITSHLPASSLATPGCQGRDINMIRIE